MNDKLIKSVSEAGIVGAGGAGFPTHVKLAAQAETVIINGAECEPLLRVDRQLMEKEAGKLLRALDLIVESAGASRGVVALKRHYHEAAAALRGELAAHPALSLCELGSFYPAGDEQVVVYEAAGRIVPEGGIPLNVGVIVVNVETALNILAAYEEGLPVTDKYLTVTGAVRSPKSVKVPIGITVSEAIELAGGATVADYAVINGGPMMGMTVAPDSVVTKTTKGLIVLPSGHSLLTSLKKPLERSIRDAAIACMQCSLCTEVCPRHLLGHRIEPHKMMRIAAYGSVCDAKQSPMNAYLCVGCRLCEYACVMGLQPWKFNASIKKTLTQNGVKNNLRDTPERCGSFRDYKLYPVSKLLRQLGLAEYDRAAPMESGEYRFSKVALPLRQGAGAPAVPVVAAGDCVARGELIAKIPDGKLGSNLHASIGGRVTFVTENVIIITSKATE
ncbi:MAG: SLBB domain-containing protein [Synergistaceae bacterium]|nr:SLBB domain-containing protein [Synergistaceae bacterium]